MTSWICLSKEPLNTGPMEQITKTLLVCVLMLVALPVMAEPVGSDLLSGESTEGEISESEMVKVITQPGIGEECLASVAIKQIDGEMRVVPAQGFLIEPGIHTINGLVTLDTTLCKPISGDQKLSGSAGLEVNFEAGKTYYIAYDRGAENAAQWRLVVWKVEYEFPLETSSQYAPSVNTGSIEPFQRP